MKLLFPIADRQSARWPALVHAACVNVLVLAGCVLSAWHLRSYAIVVMRRLFYPYALEWMEGGVLEHVARVLEGKPLYVAPSLDFVPFIYTPFYYWVCAPFAWALGPQLPSLRLVSVLASLAAFGLLFRIVFMRTGNAIAAFIGVGMLAACFEVCGGWYDLARVDSLGLCLLLLGSWLLERSGRRADLWAGVVFALAFLTKQNAAIVAAPVLAARVVTGRGRARFAGPLAFGAVVALSTWLQNRASGGAYLYYVFQLPSEHAWYPAMRREFWRSDIFTNVPFACMAALALLTASRPWRSQLQLWSAAAGYCAVSWLARLHVGGAVNGLMPVMAFLAWAAAEALHRLGSHERANGGATLWQRSIHACSSLFGLSLCVAQLVWLLYSPDPHLPDDAERKASDALVQYLRTFKSKGPVFVPFDPSLARMAGSPGSAHQQAITDVSLGHDAKKWKSLHAAIQNDFARRRYAAVVINGDFVSELQPTYVLAPLQPLTANTREGAASRATAVWIRPGFLQP